MIPAIQPKICYQYGVTLQGAVAMGDGRSFFPARNFSLAQYATLCTPGFRQNRVELWLSTGQDNNARPQLGGLELMTNSAFANNPGIRSHRIDLAAVVTVLGGGFQMDLSSEASNIMPQPNVLIASTDAGGRAGPNFLGGLGFAPIPILQSLPGLNVLQHAFIIPRTGRGWFAFDVRMQTLQGAVELSGTSLDNVGYGAVYQARFWGSLLGRYRL